jgi:dTDP-4-amino-4,6-dideoxygalactose transaminase
MQGAAAVPEPIEFVDLRRQYEAIGDELEAALLEAARSTSYILGPQVEAFEREWAAYCGSAHCVGVASGTAALELILEALGVGPGDEVIAPANTFIATVLPVVRLGARPVLVDCDAKHGQIDVEQAAEAVTERTRAVIGVHLYGHPADVDPLVELCARHGIALVEDACQAHGTLYRGRRTGSLGRAAAFSFYPGKNLGALGDAGAITTDDGDLAARVRVLRDLGQARKYEHVAVGSNERLDTLQAAVLLVKLRHLDGWNERRRAAADAYGEALAGLEMIPPEPAAWATPVHHLYVVRTGARDAVRAELAARMIATGLHYPKPVHLQPALSGLNHMEGAFPEAERWSQEGLSLPMFPELRPDEIERVAAGIADALARAAA